MKILNRNPTQPVNVLPIVNYGFGQINDKKSQKKIEKPTGQASIWPKHVTRDLHKIFSNKGPILKKMFSHGMCLRLEET